ncbi:MAG: UDPGP type 1 family protein [Planctomycetes bacterium]|nr:UDPGP type 1 family protein [Planctomycetota bacterium]
MPSLQDRHDAAKQTLASLGQDHVLRYYDELSDAQRDALLKQIEGIDWPEVARLIETHVKHKPMWTMPDHVEPAPWYPHVPGDELKPKYDEARTLGEQLVRDGKVAAFTVAGGQGSRLGYDGPKGCYPATPIRGLPLFACFAEYLHNIQNRFGCVVPWYIMTSPINDQPTRAFFEENDHFGLDPAHLMFFPQAMFPAIDLDTARVLLEAKDSLALSPNGHGGSLKALWTSGAIADMKNRGIEQVSYVQVDNPLVRVIDPLFIGLHAIDQAQMSSKMLPKAYPKEKLGNFCLANGKMTVIEYSNLPDELAEQRTPDGELRFRAGSIAIHAIRVDFVESLNTAPEGFALPWNRAEKKVAYYDESSGQTIKPEQANAVKLETFVFDALPFAQSSIIYETDRVDEFAPIKNADVPGKIEVDSPASSKRLQTDRAARWLEANGVKIPRDAQGHADATLEIKQTTAIYPDDLQPLDLPDQVEPRSELLI